MASTHAVAADVVDINSDKPRVGEVFLIDTNVWYFQTYTRASQSASPPTFHQTRTYPRYLRLALNQRSRLLRCGFSLLELSHRIEKVELEISGTRAPLKEFRKTPDARQKVLGEIKAAWSQVENMAQPVNAALKDPLLAAYLERLAASSLDAVDAILIETAILASVTQVITDDGDYCSVPGITLFTGNHGVIEAARAQGKLITRPPAEEVTK